MIISVGNPEHVAVERSIVLQKANCGWAIYRCSVHKKEFRIAALTVHCKNVCIVNRYAASFFWKESAMAIIGTELVR